MDIFYSEGFTGTGGAVKPRSSVDVDELRSSKSMDYESPPVILFMISIFCMVFSNVFSLSKLENK